VQKNVRIVSYTFCVIMNFWALSQHYEKLTISFFMSVCVGPLLPFEDFTSNRQIASI